MRSTDPLERFNRGIGRRTGVVGIFPDDPSPIRLVPMVAEAKPDRLVGLDGHACSGGREAGWCLSRIRSTIAGPDVNRPCFPHLPACIW